MDLINWEDDFSLGIDEIDKQHRNLIDLSNKYFKLLQQGKAYDSLDEIFSELLYYGDYHFKTEEKYFEQFDFEFTDEHKKIHSDFVGKILEFRKAYEDEKAGKSNKSVFVTVELWNFLKFWLTKHIKEDDKKYRDLFIEKGL
jgi:hemerythrin-like metal-binding protein